MLFENGTAEIRQRHFMKHIMCHTMDNLMFPLKTEQLTLWGCRILIERTCLECNLSNGWISHVRYVLLGPGFILLLWFEVGLTTAL